MPRLSNATIERFFAKIEYEPNTGCWIWVGARDRRGHGQVRIDWECYYAHRISLWFHGVDPAQLNGLHKCNNDWCVNPTHLYIGTQSDNGRDAVRHGTAPNMKLTAAQVIEIRHLYTTSEETTSDIGARYGITGVQVSNIGRSLQWGYIKE